MNQAKAYPCSGTGRVRKFHRVTGETKGKLRRQFLFSYESSSFGNTTLLHISTKYTDYLERQKLMIRCLN